MSEGRAGAKRVKKATCSGFGTIELRPPSFGRLQECPAAFTLKYTALGSF